eukprot:COSAG01_NODE_1131_length_11572_cov_84.273337_1_plen_241_part_00
MDDVSPEGQQIAAAAEEDAFIVESANELDRPNKRGATAAVENSAKKQRTSGGTTSDVGDDGGCCVESASELLEMTPENVRKLLQEKLLAMDGDKTFLGDIDGDRYHHNVLAAVIQDLGYKLIMIQPDNYPEMFLADRKFFVYGELNFKFQPYTQHYMTGAIEWLNLQCKAAEFWGLDRIPGAHDAREYQRVARLEHNRPVLRLFGVPVLEGLPHQLSVLLCGRRVGVEQLSQSGSYVCES